jgi:hypothetical protein
MVTSGDIAEIKSAVDVMQSDPTSLMESLSSFSNKTVSVAVLQAAMEFVSANFGWIYEVNTQGVSILVACPTGTLLVNVSVDLQECFSCEGNSYSLNPEDGCAKNDAGNVVCGPRACNICPSSGAFCAGRDNFQPVVDSSCWQKVVTPVGNSHATLMRVVSCPPGFVLVRDNADATLDQCARCPLEYYSLDRAIYPGEIMVIKTLRDLTTSDNGTAALCLPCPAGAVCVGPEVNVAIGYWRGADMMCPMSACDPWVGCDPRL